MNSTCNELITKLDAIELLVCPTSSDCENIVFWLEKLLVPFLAIFSAYLTIFGGKILLMMCAAEVRLTFRKCFGLLRGRQTYTKGELEQMMAEVEKQRKSERIVVKKLKNKKGKQSKTDSVLSGKGEEHKNSYEKTSGADINFTHLDGGSMSGEPELIKTERISQQDKVSGVPDDEHNTVIDIKPEIDNGYDTCEDYDTEPVANKRFKVLGSMENNKNSMICYAKGNYRDSLYNIRSKKNICNMYVKFSPDYPEGIQMNTEFRDKLYVRIGDKIIIQC